MPTIRTPRCGRFGLMRSVAFLCLVIPVLFSTAGATVSGVDITVPKAIVVTADSIASAVGNAVLLDGGNAVDAAVAVGFALAVTHPRAGNIGGGGFMLVRIAGGEETFIDYRETAPSRAHRDMYLGEDGTVIASLSTVGHLASGVPGTVYGLAEAHKAFGSLPWRRLVEPAVRLARDGFIVSRPLAESLEGRRTRLELHPEARRIFVTPGYLPGDRIVQADLASTLERISLDWRDFYTGETAALIAAEMERWGGLVSMEDLAGYRAVRREPLRFEYGDYKVTSAPLSSSGGVIIAQVMQMLERHGAGDLERGSAQYVHLVSEAEKVAYCSRALYLGDIDFYPSPWAELITPATALRLAALISPDGRLKVDALEVAPLLESEQTTHYSIVDQWGNAVANTYTLNGSYGSGVVVKGAGFLLNNEMDDFAIKPGYPNLYGLVGSEANAIEPGKRMLSSMSPTFVDGPDGFLLVLGSPGGSRIPTTVLQVILNVVDHGMPLYQALSAGRFHEQYLPDRIYIENGALEPAAIDGLLGLGHRIEIRRPMGDVQAILVRDGRLNGASDPRGNGRAIGH
jgi:gamma-glutamyltranspeptidase/glutathione hydrolase